ncbi:NAD(P)/FAD-dependent oxidoreductase [Vagococcus carniphilus]|uniref:NAD(P)/FAD-dependent oxidoreductase n=1 Tax=Vagococcus carniphilus TaxID=218144 RepID=UPI003BAC2636
MEDVIIVGGGPAGLYSAFYCGLREMSVKVIEGQHFLGGKLNVYKEKNVWDVGGVAPQPAKEIIKTLVEQANTFNPTFVLGKSVVDVSKEEVGFSVQTNDGEKHYAKTIILGTGTGISLPKKLDFVYPNQFETTNLYYDIPSVEAFKGKKVVISGGNSKSFQWAKKLAEVAEKVYFIYRKDLVKGSEKDIDSLMTNERITCLFDQKITKLMTQDNQRIHSVEMTHFIEESKDYLEVDAVFISHGVNKNNPLIHENSVFDLEKNLHFKIDEKGETSMEGVFAAGDAAFYDGKLRMIAESFHDAIVASNAAKRKIDPKAPERGKVSSHHKDLRNREI